MNKRSSGNERLIFIDSLRGLASLSVLGFHFYNAIFVAKRLTTPRFIHWIFIHGELGVQVFFVLSGFVIAKSINYQGLNARYMGIFILRRATRLDPLYWVIIFLTVLFYIYTSRGMPGLVTILMNGLYLDNLLNYHSLVPVGWTLQYEFQFYLVFIFLSYLFFGLIKMSFNFSMILFLPLLLLSVAVNGGWIKGLNPGLFINYWFLFFGGIVVYWSLSEKLNKVFLWCYGVIIFLLYTFFLDPKVLTGLLTVTLIYYCGQKKKLYSWLNNRYLNFLGVISYSLYLVHPFFGNKSLRMLVAKFEFSVLTSWVLFIVAVIAIIALAYIFFLIIESPSLQLSKWIGMKFNKNGRTKVSTL